MHTDNGRPKVDGDGLATFLITLLSLLLTLGIPLLKQLHSVSTTAANASGDTSAKRLFVFGKRLRHGRIDEDYRQRLDMAARLMREDSERSLLLGGAGDDRTVSEAAAGERYLLQLGLDGARIAREEQSGNTLENLRHARVLMRSDEVGTIALISNRYHLARIQTIADSLGLDYQLCGCEESFRATLTAAPRLLLEAFYILWFKTGKNWARLIGSQRMLDRVT